MVSGGMACAASPWLREGSPPRRSGACIGRAAIATLSGPLGAPLLRDEIVVLSRRPIAASRRFCDRPVRDSSADRCRAASAGLAIGGEASGDVERGS